MLFRSLRMHLITLYSSDEAKFEKAEEELLSAYVIAEQKAEKAPIIHKMI